MNDTDLSEFLKCLDFEIDPMFIDLYPKEIEKLKKLYEIIRTIKECPRCKSTNLCVHTKTATCLDCKQHFGAALNGNIYLA